MIINRELVERELKKQATEEEIHFLESNPKTWRSILVDIMQELAAQMADKKAESFGAGEGNYQALAAYHAWKARSVHFLGLVEKRLQRIKNNPGGGPSYHQPMAPILEDILEELKYISSLLEELKYISSLLEKKRGEGDL